ncbi:hypothetical protein C0992_006317, partial [Termitomyces sp. T32_za158]
MDFSGEIVQHEIIQTSLGKIFSLITEAEADLRKFDPVALKNIMSEFKEALYTHLDEEVKHISAANLKAAQFEGHDVKAMVDRLEVFAKSHGDPFLVLPFAR